MKIEDLLVLEGIKLKRGDVSYFDLEMSLNHICSELGIKKPKLVICENIVSRYDDMLTLGQYKPKENVIRIVKQKDKMATIETFIHELYHFIQRTDTEKFADLVIKGTIEKDAYKFTAKVMDRVIKDEI
jgi:hypothetical protein